MLALLVLWKMSGDVFSLPLIWSRGAYSGNSLWAVQYVAMEVINPAMIDCTLDQIGGNERVKKDLVRC